MTRKVFLLFLVAISAAFVVRNTTKNEPKITGVNLVAPPRPIGKEAFTSLKSTNARWLSVIPYAFIRPEQGIVSFGQNQHWWGEGVIGSAKTIELAKELGYKVMLKPHVWVAGQGWAGDFELYTANDWKKWEDSYAKYVLTFARQADSMGVSLFCIGTEFRKAAVKRPMYWRGLIKKVRKVYTGQITYASNWDNYQNITFWDELDFIGIDAYFPVSSDKTPASESVKTGWENVAVEIEEISKKFRKKVIFTEYGYRSIDYSADGHWKYNRDTLNVNYAAQSNAYEGMYTAVWDKPWFNGGFLWKWHLQKLEGRNRGLTKEFTPQGKPVLDIIKKYYQ